jgi:hypothetical protein
MSFFEWLGRVIMLVLAGMITLSIIGAIVAIPYGMDLPRQIGLERPLPPEPEVRSEPSPPGSSPERSEAGAASPGPPGSAALAAVQPDPVDPAEWLEVIAYALLALAGLGALGILIVWRSLHQRRRIADALEALAARG